MTKSGFYISLSLFAFTACRKPYLPTAITANGNYLVVEGFINTSATDSTIIKLSRTVLLNAKTTTSVETKAKVNVEDAQGTVYPLKEIVSGTYAAVALNLNNAKQYRLRIITSNGKTYLSSLVTPKVTPPIDSIGFSLISNGMQIYVNAHDATNNTRYYKWTYNETWQFHAFYRSFYVTNGVAIVPRSTAAQQIYTCFGTDASTDVLINTTESLSRDVVYQFPITSIASSSEKIETKYSILLKQQAIDKDAYLFWQLLKKNTETLGSIFDAQPSQLIGNITNIADATEPVIAYISAGTVSQKRIFLTAGQLPNSWKAIYPFDCSNYGNAYYKNPTTGEDEVTRYLIPLTTPATIYSSINNSAGDIIGFTYTNRECADCTLRGSINQPSYWK